MFEGIFTVNPGRADEFQLRNTLLTDGAEYIQRTIWRGEALLPATYYIGLTNVNPGFAATLAAVVAGEPVGNGYARQAAVRNTTDWTHSLINNAWRVRSKTVTFTSTGVYTVDWTRLFVCNAAAGSVGKVFALSGPSLVANHVINGTNPQAFYDFWIRP